MDSGAADVVKIAQRDAAGAGQSHGHVNGSAVNSAVGAGAAPVARVTMIVGQAS